MIELTEAQVKRGCEDYLTYQQNQGKLWWTRLNAGDIYIPNKDGSKRVFKGAGAGTADLMVIQGGNVQTYYKAISRGTPWPIAMVTFIECKSTKGKQSTEQVEFSIMIKGFNCRYAVVRSVDELQEILNGE
ncbi:hypothetical protein LCGC14_0981110 [marine sediment metagenome]|uniref:Uncharacterized protein n=1 Tax=marine sediment metagenome TaxID=412755 RepID=A0A0F9ND51_9ZZZZ